MIWEVVTVHGGTAISGYLQGCIQAPETITSMQGLDKQAIAREEAMARTST